MAHYFTPEQGKFLQDNVKGRGNLELAELFNAHFCLDLRVSQIKSYKSNHKLSSGLTGWFKPGHVPAITDNWRKSAKFRAAQFKKGNKPHNLVPIGSERVRKGGYLEIKIQQGKGKKNWKRKHILIWEDANGPVPEGYAIMFGDGDNRNFDLDNLLLVSKKQMARINQMGLIQNDAELTKTGLIIADIHNKIGERKRLKRNK